MTLADIPPAPGSEELPPKPDFGWRMNMDHLTQGEYDTISQLIGPLDQEDSNSLYAWMTHTAIAYARRLNPKLYQFKHAKLLKMGDLDREPEEDEEGKDSSDSE